MGQQLAKGHQQQQQQQQHLQPEVQTVPPDNQSIAMEQLARMEEQRQVTGQQQQPEISTMLPERPLRHGRLPKPGRQAHIQPLDAEQPQDNSSTSQLLLQRSPAFTSNKGWSSSSSSRTSHVLPPCSLTRVMTLSALRTLSQKLSRPVTLSSQCLAQMEVLASQGRTAAMLREVAFMRMQKVAHLRL